MIPLREIDVLGVFVSPAACCIPVAVFAAALLRRLLDRTAINRHVWNRALFDLSVMMILGFLLILSLRFGE
ncbi:DUF1656 domain-containing protein [Rhizosaccharibacter radicis]|uniref:DUF1656 domain-containing protein n=1 Tax=Rhizosaccharibacter radicis TaxID=2782605 RepID=A0ABT1VUZ7_9PROT|nr:DUF1656 domain-containing protein [Acetobacteraceae bacterium KSS12]